ncbi:autotransporter outer membrane beta-barrel domain-containing protein [Bartonella sp. B10]
MISVFRNHVFSCTFTTAILYFLQIMHSNSSGSSCNPDEEFYTCSDGGTHTIQNKTYRFTNPQKTSSIPVAIKVQKQGTVINAEKITVTGSADSRSGYGVDVSEKGKVVLSDSAFRNVEIGLKVNDGIIHITGGSIEESGMAVNASGRGTDVALSQIEVKTNNAIASFLSSDRADIRLAGMSVDVTNSSAFYSKLGGTFRIENVQISGWNGRDNNSSAKAVMHLLQNGYALFRTNSVDVTGVHGLLIENSSGTLTSDMNKIKSSFNNPQITKADIKNSTIIVRGDASYGMYFRKQEEEPIRDGKASPLISAIDAGLGAVYLSNTIFTVPESTAIYSAKANGYINLSEDTRVSGDLLLKAVDGASVVILADSSILVGGAHVYDGAHADLNLHRGSRWILKKRRHRSEQKAELEDSCISSVSLVGSTIDFDDQFPDQYQTLYIGKGEGNVYRAQGNVQIHLSASLNHDDLFDHQKIDRVLIHGDVSGKTLVRIKNSLGTSKQTTDDRMDNRSVSIIQVSGKAQEDSFMLIDKYTTLNGSPYQYHLRAYGPGSSLGEANSAERLVAGDENFWDFRLECSYINPHASLFDIVPAPSIPRGSSYRDSTSVSPTAVKPSSTDHASVPSDLVEYSSTNVVPITSETLEPHLTDSSSVSSETLEPFSTDSSSVSSDTLESSSIDSLSISVDHDSMETTSVEPISVLPDSAKILPTDSSHLPSDSVEYSSIDDPQHTSLVQHESKVKAVVPQLPTYLLLPNTLFHTGLMDIKNQNKQLDITRGAFRFFLNSDKNSAFFAHGYSGNYRYASNLSAFDYGYGSELDYNALEAGILLKDIENLYSHTFLGIMGNYGSFYLYPKDVEESRKSAFNRWSVSAYGSIQHDMGLYIDGLLSYGLFNGDVLTLVRGKTAKLKGKLLSTSLTNGRVFMTEHKGFVFDPQIQVVYQHLQFDKEHDVDDLDIDMGKFNQWTVRVGGRLTKELDAFEDGHVISFYGKLNFMHSFGKKQTVYFKDNFQLGDFGSSLEIGFGFNARLSSSFALYSDLIYEHKLTKAGFSGTSFSGGLRYHF